jgi:hypothetical protein
MLVTGLMLRISLEKYFDMQLEIMERTLASGASGRTFLLGFVHYYSVGSNCVTLRQERVDIEPSPTQSM